MRTTLLAAVVAATLASAAVAQAQYGPAPSLIVLTTMVIRYQPHVPSGDVREGSCWTESIAVTRSGAWRCSVGNAISDPCFTIPGKTGELVCGANPALKSDGFVLKLTKPLPAASEHNQKPEPWLFRLADNSVCEAMTGTLAPVNGEPARWECAIHVRDQVRPTGYVTKLTPGKPWVADKFIDSAVGKTGVEPIRVPVKIVWE